MNLGQSSSPTAGDERALVFVAAEFLQQSSEQMLRIRHYVQRQKCESERHRQMHVRRWFRLITTALKARGLVLKLWLKLGRR
jgi:hypothetical protein